MQKHSPHPLHFPLASGSVWFQFQDFTVWFEGHQWLFCPRFSPCMSTASRCSESTCQVPRNYGVIALLQLTLHDFGTGYTLIFALSPTSKAICLEWLSIYSAAVRFSFCFHGTFYVFAVVYIFLLLFFDAKPHWIPADCCKGLHKYMLMECLKYVI